MSPLAQASHVVVTVHCTHCHGVVDLESEGLPAYPGYQTYNEYICPHCHKQNIQRTSGAIVDARKQPAAPS